MKDIVAVREEIGAVVEERMQEFAAVGASGAERWFSELCFCLLTANARADTAIAIQEELGFEGFMGPAEEIRACLQRHGHRFHNTKTRYIVEAREHVDIKEKVERIVEEYDVRYARAWIVDQVKGIGYKEASHFLRNTGHDGVAILDRHIVRYLAEQGLVEDGPMTKKRYLQGEAVFLKIAEELDMHAGALDLYVWYLRTGKVLK